MISKKPNYKSIFESVSKSFNLSVLSDRDNGFSKSPDKALQSSITGRKIERTGKLDLSKDESSVARKISN